MGKSDKSNLILKHILREFILFIFGGVIYLGIEIAWRGYTHWSMGIVGGLCFVVVGLLNETYDFQECMEIQALKSAGIVTLIEFVSGWILNIKLGWGVWDYSNLPLNVWGQVCPFFMIMWFFLSIPAIYIDDVMRYLWWQEPQPKYIWCIMKLFQKKENCLKNKGE